MKLDDIHKKNVFQTPDDYFEKLPQQIMQKVENKKSAPSFVTVFQQNFKYIAAACAFLLVLTVGFWSSQTQTIEPVELSDASKAILDEISEDEMQEYLLLIDYSDDDMFTMVDAQDIDFELNEEEVDTSTEDLMLLDIDVTELEIYL